MWTLINAIGAVGDYMMLVISVVYVTLRRPPAWRLIKDQMFSIGVLSLPVIAFTGFSTGMVLAAQAFFQLSEYGLASGTGLMVGKAMTVELGPVLTAFMVTGRVGAAMCAELGTMHVSEQIDALRSMAVNPLRHLVAPRFIAGIAMVPFLTVISAVMGVGGGYLIAVYYYKMPARQYLDPLPIHIENFDIFSGFVKALFFGLLIVTISCYIGMNTKGGAAGVGRATTRSVVVCYSMILLSNFFITLAINTSYPFLHELLGGWL